MTPREKDTLITNWILFIVLLVSSVYLAFSGDIRSALWTGLGTYAMWYIIKKRGN